MSAATARGDAEPIAATVRSADPRHRRPAIPAEERLLLLMAGGAGNDAAIREIVRQDVDWRRFLGLAHLERAVPVVYRQLCTMAPSLVPAEIFDEMRRLALVSDFAMLHLESRLRESLRVLERAQVRVMLIKGAALAYSVYSGVRERPMSDIDVLVGPGDARTARRVMLEAGWREIVGGIPEGAYEHHHHLPPLYDARSPDLQLEIHTALFPERQPFAFDAADLWARARPLGGGFPGVLVPAPVHALVHACLHFFWSHQARFGAWRTIRDIDAISSTQALNWEEFTALARAVRGGTSCYWSLRIAHAAARVAVPPSVLEALRPRRPSYVLHALERHFLMNLFPVRSLCPSVKLEQLIWEVAAMPSASGHGAVRPWDEDEKFVSAMAKANVRPAAPPSETVGRLLAFPTYIASLLRSSD
jgi:hypothetical protein